MGRTVAQQKSSDKIAVIGMAGRFPGSPDIASFWDLLVRRRSGLTSVDADDLVHAGLKSDLLDEPDYVPFWGGPPDLDGFDSTFFGYSPRDADLLDPQQRLFLECAWHALEDAGYASEDPSASIGVYAGSSLSSYLLRAAGRAEEFDAGLANIGGMVAARTSFHLNLTGPSIGIQTTCSSSLVALQQAMHGLRSGDCDLALAGAVAVNQPRPEGYFHKKEGILSPDGTCRPFDAAAAGTVFCNGAGVVVLKRLSDAIADKDSIRGVLLGLSVNNDGSQKVSITAPSVKGQATVLEAALREACVGAEDIDYIEAHGTGTALGDPIEVKALNRVYGPGLRGANRRCGLGAVKGNTGHLDAAAGMAGLIKVLLAFEHEYLPGTAHFSSPSKRCDFGAFDVVGDGWPWSRNPERPRRAGLSSFGIGGTNTHLILEEPPLSEPLDSPNDLQLLPISAATDEALKEICGSVADSLESGKVGLADTAFTLQVGRRSHDRRIAVAAKPSATAADLLKGKLDDAVSPMEGSPSPIFLFSGQGSQFPGMASGLNETFGVFQESLEACLQQFESRDVLRELLLNPDLPDAAAIHQTRYTQPALFAFGFALARQWMSLGLAPAVLIGHSIGEITAGAIAGVFQLADACRLVEARGVAMQDCTPGAMLAALLSEAEASGSLPDGVEVAAINGPRSVVLAGPEREIEQLSEWFDRSGIGCKRIPTSHAFHSSMMEPALDPFRSALADVALSEPLIPILSNVTGTWLTAIEATDPSYWVRHIRQPVRFGEGVKEAAALDHPLFVEIGPGSGLARFARQQMRGTGREVASVPSAGSNDAASEFLTAIGSVWSAGVPIKWDVLHKSPRRRVPLPGYPFQRQTHWLPPATHGATLHSEAAILPANWVYQPVWKRLPLTPTVAEPAQIVFGMDAIEDLIPRDRFDPEPVSVVASSDGSFEQVGHGFRIDPFDTSHYSRVFDSIAGSGVFPSHVVVAWGLGQSRQLRSSDLTRGVVALAQSLMATELRPRLTLVGAGMEDVTGGEALDPGAAMSVGLLRVLEQEVPGLNVGSLDLDPAELDRPVRGLREALEAAQKGCPRRALRGGRQWVLDHVQTPVESPMADTGSQRPILIAGDLLHGLALAYARGVRCDWQSPIVLAGSGLPSRLDFAADEGSSGDDEAGEMMSRLADLGEIGRDILIFQGDCGDQDWLDHVFQQVEARFAPVGGVFYTSAMGDAFFQPLAEVSRETFDEILDGRLSALRALRQVLSKRPADFCFVQSSLSVLAGGLGFGPYAAANAWIDAFCGLAQRDGTTQWHAVQWDVAETSSIGDAAQAISHTRVLTANEVWERSRAILSVSSLDRAVVTPVALEQRLALAAKAAEPSQPIQVAQKTPSRPYIAPRDEYEIAVAAVMAEMLGVEQVGADDNFFEMGGHSLIAIQIIGKLRQKFEIELPVRALLYEAPTVAGIASVIRSARDAAELEVEALEDLLDEVSAEVEQDLGSRKAATGME
ncbi:MAG: beta-ketoacyl synthase N-terminal-like domain-containing protein [Pseudomonadota bacterium]